MAAVAIVLLSPSANALGTIGNAGVRIGVWPAVGSKRTHFVVGFTAQRTGFVPSRWSGYRVVASSRAARGCSSAVAVVVPPTSQGEHVRVTLRPGGASRSWCQGTYAGRLEETFRPTCGFREMCPLARPAFATFIGYLTVGRFRFRVR